MYDSRGPEYDARREGRVIPPEFDRHYERDRPHPERGNIACLRPNNISDLHINWLNMIMKHQKNCEFFQKNESLKLVTFASGNLYKT